MKFWLEQIQPPEVEPLTLQEAKVHLRAYSNETGMDALIEGLIGGAREWAEQFTGKAYVDQTWRLSLEPDTREVFVGDSGALFGSRYGYYSGMVRYYSLDALNLCRSPILSIDSVKSFDTLNNETVFDPSSYLVRGGQSRWPRVVMTNGSVWTIGTRLEVQFRAGYVDRSTSPPGGLSLVPNKHKQAMLLWLSANYDMDESKMGVLLEAAECLLKNDRTILGLQ